MGRFVRPCRDFLPYFRSDGRILDDCHFQVRTVGFLGLVVYPNPFVHMVIFVRFHGANVGEFRTIGETIFSAIRRSICFALKDGRSKSIRPFTSASFHVQFRILTSFIVALRVGTFRPFCSEIPRRFISNGFVRAGPIVREEVLSLYALMEMSFENFTKCPFRFLRGEASLRRLLGNV